MKLKLLLLFFLLIVAVINVKAQNIKGQIKSVSGEVIPFASIYVKELKTGTTSNKDGYYQFPLSNGTYHIFYQALGFERKETLVTVADKDIIKNIELQSQEYAIKEVKVYGGKEDPAYAIMRKAISLAPYFQHQVKSYDAMIYLKGGFDLDKVPFLVRKQLKEEGMEEGKTYVAESVNEIKFTAPDNYEHKQISKRSSLPDDNEDQVMNYINYSFYDVDNEDLISPLSRKSFSFYKFQYQGFFRQGEYYVNKIKVTPRRKSQQLFTGYIYIVDQLWNLHSVDLNNEQFWGNIQVKQVMEEVEDKVWLPVSHNFLVDVKVMGFKLKANYGGSVEYTQVTPDTELQVPKMLQLAYEDMADSVEDTVPVTKNQKKIDELMSKDELNNRDMLKLTRLMEKERKEKTEEPDDLEIDNWSSHYKIVKDTLKKDTVHWDAIRPIPLSESELHSFQVKDSLKLVATEKTTNAENQNSTSKSKKVSNLVLSGNWYNAKKEGVQFRYAGLIDLKGIDFNAVDGYAYANRFALDVHVDSLHTYSMQPVIGYGFSRNTLLWKVDNNYTFAPMRRGNVFLNFGQKSADFNGQTGINHYVNALSSLLFKDNYMRLYQNNYLTAGLGMDIANGLRFDGQFTVSQSKRLENTTNHSWLYPNSNYDENNSIYDQNVNAFSTTKNSILDVQLSYTPKYYYRVFHGKKHMDHSDYPTFTLKYQKALANVFDSNTDYDLLEFQVKQSLNWSFMYGLDYEIGAGNFFNHKSMHFSQYKHFNTAEVPISLKSWSNSFAMLNDYKYSINDWFAYGTLNYSTPYLFIKNLWFLQNKLWKENIYFRHISQRDLKNYNEIGYGITQLYLMGNLGIFAGFDNDELLNWGVRVSINLP